MVLNGKAESNRDIAVTVAFIAGIAASLGRPCPTIRPT